MSRKIIKRGFAAGIIRFSEKCPCRCCSSAAVHCATETGQGSAVSGPREPTESHVKMALKDPGSYVLSTTVGPRVDGRHDAETKDSSCSVKKEWPDLTSAAWLTPESTNCYCTATSPPTSLRLLLTPDPRSNMFLCISSSTVRPC